MRRHILLGYKDLLRSPTLAQSYPLMMKQCIDYWRRNQSLNIINKYFKQLESGKMETYVLCLSKISSYFRYFSSTPPSINAISSINYALQCIILNIWSGKTIQIGLKGMINIDSRSVERV